LTVLKFVPVLDFRIDFRQILIQLRKIFSTGQSKGMDIMKRKGSSIIFVNNKRQVLLFLRDNKPDIPYPDTWDVPGGHVEEEETPEQCIVREMREEMGIVLKDFQLFSMMEFDDRIEYTFWKSENLDINKIILTEGQCLRWFTEDEVYETVLAYGFNRVMADFFKSEIFL
jgi:8-oxo-dGTP diphosphatase